MMRVLILNMCLKDKQIPAFEKEEYEKQLNIIKRLTKICVYVALIDNSNIFATSLYWIKPYT